MLKYQFDSVPALSLCVEGDGDSDSVLSDDSADECVPTKEQRDAWYKKMDTMKRWARDSSRASSDDGAWDMSRDTQVKRYRKQKPRRIDEIPTDKIGPPTYSYRPGDVAILAV